MSFGLPYGKKEKGSDGKRHSINSMNGERFVYYDRLKEDAATKGWEWADTLHKKANSVLKWRIDYGSNPQNIRKYFANLARYEFEKEKELLETYFKTSYDMGSMQCGQDLIEAYNKIFGVSEVFRRNALLIANTAQKNLVSFFPHYLDKALEEWVNDKEFSKEVKKIIKEDEKISKDSLFDLKETDSGKIASAIEKYINKHILEITKLALEKMFSEETKAESGLKKVKSEDYEKLGKAYKEILDALDDLNKSAQTNQFIKGVIKNYDLHGLGKMIADKLKGQNLNKNNIKDAMRGFKFEAKSGSGKQKQSSQSGGLMEIFGIYNAQVNLSNKGTKIDGLHTGKLHKGAEQKADMIFLLGFDEGAAEAAGEKFNNFEGTGRGSNVGDVKNFTEELFEDFGNEKGFMILVNSKNYTLNSKFKNGYLKEDGSKIGGYSAGSAINLSTWDDMMHKMDIRTGRDFIFTIMQLIPHAIGNPQGNDEKMEEVSTMFERAIGSALFDDFEPEDPYDKNGKKKAGLRTIHLLYLNGVYIPLSVFYTLLSEAFGELEKSLDRNELIDVKFNLPKDILYPTQEDQERANVKHPWTEQSNKALREITVSYHFFSGFKKFMETFYKKP